MGVDERDVHVVEDAVVPDDNAAMRYEVARCTGVKPHKPSIETRPTHEIASDGNSLNQTKLFQTGTDGLV